MTQKGSGFRPEVADIIIINKDEIQSAPEVEIGEPSVIAGSSRSRHMLITALLPVPPRRWCCCSISTR